MHRKILTESKSLLSRPLKDFSRLILKTSTEGDEDADDGCDSNDDGYNAPKVLIAGHYDDAFEDY